MLFECQFSVHTWAHAEFVLGTLRAMMLQRQVKGRDVQAAALTKHLQVLIELAARNRRA